MRKFSVSINLSALLLLIFSFFLLLLGTKIALAADNYVFSALWPVTPVSANPSNGIAVDLAGNVYVADSANNQIQKYDPSGAFIMKWGSVGPGPGFFDTPNGVAVDLAGNIYVADTRNHRIQKFNSSASFIKEWGSFGTGNGQFQYPSGIAVDILGNIYVADTNNHRIQKFSSVGTFIAKWGISGTANGQLRYPGGIAVDLFGGVYVADTNNHRIQLFNSSGAFILKWGSFGTGDGQFKYPAGLATDLYGNVYVSDSSNHRVQKFSGGSFVTKWGSTGVGIGQFYSPNDVTVDIAGNVYVMDSHNQRVQKFSEELSFTPAGLWSSGVGGWDAANNKLASGDFNNDGYQDIVSFYNYPANRQVKAWVWLNDGKGNYGAPQVWWDSGPGNWDWAGAKLSVAHFKLYGQDDLVVFYGYPAQRQTRAFVFRSNGVNGFNNPTIWWDSGPGNWDWNGTKLAVGDYNGDNQDDLAAFYGYFNERQARAFVFTAATGKFNAPTTWWDSGPGNWDWAGTKLASGDFNVDGGDDLLAFYGYFTQHQTRAFVFTAATGKFNAPTTWWDSGPGNWDWAGTKLSVGYFDSNMGSDIVALYGYTGNQARIFVFSSNYLTNNFNAPTMWWDSGPGNWDWSATTILSGNVSGNAYIDELLGFYDQGAKTGRIFSFN